MDFRLLRNGIIILATALICATSVAAQTNDEDTTANYTTLQEFVVAAPQSLKTGNKTLFYPSKELKESFSTSSQLLAGLQIPDLIVNPASGEIAISGGGTLAIRINGHIASQTDLMALSSKDITKVEFTSHPGVRYGDAAGVLELTVKTKAEGYGIFLNILQSPNRGWGDYTASVRYNVGRSEWSADYHSNPMWSMNCYRDNKETINFGDYGSIIRTEHGIKTPNNMVTHRAALQYSYAGNGGLLLNVQARLFRQKDRYVSTGLIITEYDSNFSEALETESAPYSSWQGDLDVYLHIKINTKNKIYFNLVPTVLSSTSNRLYETEDISFYSKIDSKDFYILSEGVWEGRIGSGMMTAGFRANMRNATGEYIPENISIKDSGWESCCFAEWNHNIGNVRYSIGGNATWTTLKSPVSKDYLNFVPKLFLRYSPFTKGGVSISVEGSTVNPSISQLNPAIQRIDRFQYTQGNPTLSPYRTYKSSLGFDFSIKDVCLSLEVSDKYSHRPIMGGKILEGDRIIQSFYNAGYHNDLIIKGQLRIPLFIRQLTLSTEGGWHKTICKGVNYRHTYSRPFINAQLMYMSGPWWIMAKYNNSYNILWGENISSVNNNLLNLGFGFRHKAATFMAGIVNPIGKVSIKSRDLSSLAGYERTYYAASTNSLVWLGMTLNISQGRKRSAGKKKLENNNQYESIKNVLK